MGTTTNTIRVFGEVDGSDARDEVIITVREIALRFCDSSAHRYQVVSATYDGNEEGREIVDSVPGAMSVANDWRDMWVEVFGEIFDRVWTES